MNIFLLFLVFICTLALSTALTFMKIKKSTKIAPSQRCSHAVPTPTSAGLVFGSLFILSVIFSQFYFPTHTIPWGWSYCLGATLLIIVGYYDDKKVLSYKLRLSVQICSAFLLIASGAHIETPAISLNTDSIVFFKQVITLFTILCIINGANFIDGLNGLLGLTTLITLIVAPLWVHFDPALCFLHLQFIAALCGFLLFNVPKGRIFMGDAGSTFIGYTLCYLALCSQPIYSQYDTATTAIFNKGFVFLLLPMAFVWFDVGFTLVRRAILGKQLTQPHRDHMIHILYDAINSHLKVTSIYVSLTLFASLLTYLCFKETLSFLGLMLAYAFVQSLFVCFVFRLQNNAKSKNQQ